ncbi:MAG: TetR/AcrR family transcriptional regulator [Ignavibacteriaceae bacterium]
MEKGRKLQIVKAADKRFAKHGLNKTTLDEIARDLRIGKATIYHYFNSKNELFYAALDWEAAQFLDDIKNIFNNKELDLKNRFTEYLNYKEIIYQKYKLIYESLLILLREENFEEEAKFAKNLFSKEEELLNTILANVFTEKKETVNASVISFLVNQSWGFLFTGKISPTVDTVRQSPSKEILLATLENYFGKN